MSRRPSELQKSVSGTRIHYVIPAELHRRAKAEAAMRGMTLKDFVISVLSNAVAERRKKP